MHPIKIANTRTGGINDPAVLKNAQAVVVEVRNMEYVASQ